MFFWWICGGESGFLSYSSALLGLPSEKVFIPLSFLKDDLARYGILGYCFSFINILIMSSHSLLAWKLQLKDLSVILWKFPCMLLFSLAALQFSSVQFSSFQLLSHVRLFVSPWIAASQASLSITTPGVHSNSRVALKNLFFAFAFWQFNYNVPWYVLICIHLFGVLQISWNWKSIFLSTLKKLSTIVALNILSFSFYFYYPSEVPIMIIFHFHHVS